MAVGEIDRSTAPLFDIDLRDTIDTSVENFVHVDCSGVTFMDSAGYRVLVGATEYAVRRGHTLVLRDMSPPCAMLIHLCDSNHVLRIEHSIPSSVGASGESRTPTSFETGT